jgi:hypothetical protein
VLALRVERAVELRPVGRAHHVGTGLCTLDAHLRDLEVGVAGERLVDQARERVVTEAAPPWRVELRRGVGRRRCAVEAERARVELLRGRRDAVRARTTAERENQRGGERNDERCEHGGHPARRPGRWRRSRRGGEGLLRCHGCHRDLLLGLYLLRQLSG